MPFTRWALRFIAGTLKNEEKPITATDGAEYTPDFANGLAMGYFHFCKAMGIGTSSAAFSRSQYELQSLFLKETALDVGLYVEEDSTGFWLVRATFVIETEVTITEIACYGAFMDVDGIEREFMICRDVLAEPISLTPGQLLTLEYKFITSTGE